MHYLPKTVPAEAVEAIRPAFAHGYSGTAEEWIQRCRDDLAQLWRDGSCWAITQIVEGAEGRVIHCKALAGSTSATLVHEMEAFGKARGCSAAIYEGRPGWARRNKDYRLRAVLMEKEL